MIKIECSSLEEVYQEACQRLECSITDIHIDIVQYPRNIFGIIKKKAIVIACKKEYTDDSIVQKDAIIDIEKPDLPKKDTVSDIKQPIKEFSSPVLDNFYASSKTILPNIDSSTNSEQIIQEISNTIRDVFCLDCLDCKLQKVEFLDEKTIYIKFDGKDTSLMIGKNGHRYKALSYLIFSYIFPKYNLFVKVEVGQFLFNQNEMIKRHLKSFCEDIEACGYGNTDLLDGVLLHLGVEYLREKFPNKMVVVKTNKDSTRYIKVSDFRK